MTQGLSGSFGINGTNFALQPSEFGWTERQSLGISGDAHLIYSSVRQFEMKWNLVNMSDWNQFLGFYDLVSTTGTVIIDLPKYHSSDYRFVSYTGCIINEPVMGTYFNGYPQEISITIRNIRTE